MHENVPIHLQGLWLNFTCLMVIYSMWLVHEFCLDDTKLKDQKHHFPNQLKTETSLFIFYPARQVALSLSLFGACVLQIRYGNKNVLPTSQYTNLGITTLAQIMWKQRTWTLKKQFPLCSNKYNTKHHLMPPTKNYQIPKFLQEFAIHTKHATIRRVLAI